MAARNILAALLSLQNLLFYDKIMLNAVKTQNRYRLIFYLENDIIRKKSKEWYEL